MTIREALKSVSNYPVPARVFETAAITQGITLDEEATQEMLASKEYQLAKADILRWLVKAPSVSEMGVSFSFTSEERKAFKLEADKIISGKDSTGYGYFGNSL